jgi:riboflavin synthase
MFTGIVEELGVVENLTKRQNFLRLGIKAKKILPGLKTGDSIAVNGVCLTVIEIKKDAVFFDCIEETLKLTNLGRLRLNDKVNLERPLKSEGFLSGHFVTGHIDGRGKIVKKINKGEQLDLFVAADKEILAYLVPKGSIALDGVSLTLVETGQNGFSVSLIPHTLRMTILGFKKSGDWVNIEVDIFAKYVKNFSLQGEQNKTKITLEFLRSHGFG